MLCDASSQANDQVGATEGCRAYTPPVSANATRAVALGLLAGVLAGLLGIGGGLVIIPGLVLWLGLTQHNASGTSLAAVVASAGAALISFGIDGAVDWRAAMMIAIGALAGVSVGARVLHRIPAKVLARAFSAVVIIAAIRMAF
jgi:uncharacterized membrane protein YfcA